MSIINKSDCDKWFENKDVDPRTGKFIKKKNYKLFKKNCIQQNHDDKKCSNKSFPIILYTPLKQIKQQI